jgi:hypothetical protein
LAESLPSLGPPIAEALLRCGGLVEEVRMSRKHTLIVSLSLALAAAAGLAAVTSTVHVGRSSRKVAAIAIARRSAQLDRFEAALRAQLEQRPPALPKLPAVPGEPAASGRVVQRVEYVRPPAIVIHRHRPGGDGSEGRDSGEHGDGAQAGDD